MPQPIKLGILVPSSNTSLEPLTNTLLSKLSSVEKPTVTVHYSRFPVTQIALSATALSQFDDSTILKAAKLLADAEVDLIGWSGTSAGWLGFEADERLCRRIEEETGIKATTSVLGLNRLLDISRGSTGHGHDPSFGFVTPYLHDVSASVCKTYGEAGYLVSAESHLNKTVNTEFARVDEDTLDRQMEEVVGKLGAGSPKIVSTFCTNLRAAQRVAHWEGRYDNLIVLDTVATVVWDMLRILEVDYKGIEGWGKLFQL